MTQLAIRVTETLAYQCYWTETGRDKRDVGPPWRTPKEAARYADLIDQPYTSPLSAFGEAATSIPVLPPESGLSAASPEPLRLGQFDPSRP